MSNIMNKKIFASNLRRFLDAHNMQDKDLCVITGASQTAVSEWLSAKKYPRIDKIEKIANYFGVPKSALIEDREESGRREIERQAASIIHALPDTYKILAVDYLRYLAERAKKGDNAPTVHP